MTGRWRLFPREKPAREGLYLVYIDQTAANAQDTMITLLWRGGRWEGTRPDCPVTHWQPRPRPPAGTWMARLRYGHRRSAA
jgi:hypothetical protein